MRDPSILSRSLPYFIDKETDPGELIDLASVTPVRCRGRVRAQMTRFSDCQPPTSPVLRLHRPSPHFSRAASVTHTLQAHHEEAVVSPLRWLVWPSPFPAHSWSDQTHRKDGHKKFKELVQNAHTSQHVENKI